MNKPKSKTLGNQRILVSIALPFTIIFWMIGWIFYYFGTQKNFPQTNRESNKIIHQKMEPSQKLEQEIIEPKILI